jgi:hypothetical protein
MAYHASAAHDLPAAFAAAVRAGVAAEQVSALAAAAAHFETALDLWDRVADPASAAGMDLAELPKAPCYTSPLPPLSAHAVRPLPYQESSRAFDLHRLACELP